MADDVEVRGDLGENAGQYLLHWMGWGRKSGLLELHGPAEQRFSMRFVDGRLTECHGLGRSAPHSLEREASFRSLELGWLLREPLLWNEGRFVLHSAEDVAEESAESQRGIVASDSPQLAVLVADGLLKGQYRLPTLSEAALKIRRMSRDPRSSLKQLSDVISTEPELTHAVLRYANSCSDGPAHAIDSLPMAVARVGYRTIRPLAFAVCLFSRPTRSTRLHSFQSQLWRHSLAVALLSRHLSFKLKLDDDETFLCALLHDMGKSVLLGLIDEILHEKPALRALDGIEGLLVEQHSRVGRKLPLSWNLPASVDSVAAFHHRPEEAIESQRLVAVVSLANTTINFLETDGNLPDSADLLLDPAARILALGLRQVENLAAAAMESFEQGQSFLG